MSIDINKSTLFHEKYRPTSIENIILPSNLKNKFESIVKKNDIPNMLFYSTSPGVGKTTTAKVLANECDVDYKYINGSLERGIDTLRNLISRYAESLSFDGKMKLVIYDEFDGSTIDLQNALRAAIEEYSNSCRFILIVNNINSIIEPIRSRVDCVDFNFLSIEHKKHMIPLICRRVCEILKEENIKYDNNDTIAELVLKEYPDIRTIIKLLRDCFEQFGEINKNIFNINIIHNEFYEMVLNKKLTDARKYINSNNINFNDVYRMFKENFIDKKMISNKEKISEIVCILNEYDYRNYFVSDKELNFMACLFNMFNVL